MRVPAQYIAAHADEDHGLGDVDGEVEEGGLVHQLELKFTSRGRPQRPGLFHEAWRLYAPSRPTMTTALTFWLGMPPRLWDKP